MYATIDDSAADVGDYDQTSIRYTGRNIPSRSFRLLQHLTGGTDDSATPPGRNAFHTSNQPVRLSVCLSVRHTPVLCRNEGTQRDAVFTFG